MAAISQKIGNLIGGVSQQPDSVKFNGQLRLCDNYYPDVATGLIKRPGLRGISKLNNAIDNGTWFMVFRDDEEKYIMQFSKAGALKIWNADSGAVQTLNAVAAESTAYAVHESFEDLQTLQINDFIFVLNKTIKVQEAATTSAAQTPYAFVNINTIAYSSTYTVVLDANTFTYSTPTTSTTQLNIKDIVDGLVTTINGNANWVATGIGNSIHIRRSTNVDFAIEAKGGNAGTAIEAFKGTVTAVGQLPKQFLNDLKIKVSGSDESAADDYWVIFKTSNNGASGAGIWEETIAPSTKVGLNEETMPHVIIREANGSFTYRKLDLASASSSPSTITGIPTSITINSTTSAGNVVGEILSVTGGTGTGLTLRVEATRTDTTISISNAASSSYVRRKDGKNLYYVLDNQVGKTDKSVNKLVVGDKTYEVNGSFQTVNNQLRAGLKITQTVLGVIDKVVIQTPGQGYTVADVVTTIAGDTFNVATTNSQALTADGISSKYWKPREVGDATTNPYPTFVGYPVDSIAFFKNRLIFTSRQNVICSQAGDYFNFFAKTVITIVDSDPIDLSASSTKPLRLRHSLATPTGLLVCGDNGQYILETTTEAFAPKTAELNAVATFNQTERISPIDIGPGYVFIEEGQKASAVYEMNINNSAGAKPTIQELTRIIPSYIPSGILEMKVSQSAGTFAILSKQEQSSLFIYRWFQNGEQGRIASWFKWKLPGVIETFNFDQDIMYVVTKHNTNYVVSKVSLVTDTPSQSLLFEDTYIDVRLDLFDYNPTLVYDAATDTTHVCFKDGLEDLNEQAVLMFLDSDIAGYFETQTLQYDATQPTGQKYFLTVDGNQTTSHFAIGYQYDAVAQFPAFYFIKDESRASKDTLNIPRVSRIKVNSYNSGPYRAIVRTEGRDEFSLELPQINADKYLANNIPIIRNAQSTIPVLARGDQFEFELIADSPFPTAFTSLDWEGTYDNKGIRPV